MGWTIGLLVSSALVPTIGGVYGAIREQPADSRDGVVLAFLGGAITIVWLAAGVLTWRAF